MRSLIITFQLQRLRVKLLTWRIQVGDLMKFLVNLPDALLNTIHAQFRLCCLKAVHLQLGRQFSCISSMITGRLNSIVDSLG